MSLLSGYIVTDMGDKYVLMVISMVMPDITHEIWRFHEIHDDWVVPQFGIAKLAKMTPISRLALL